jgi:mannan endo-1,4-beta-mannosidase
MTHSQGRRPRRVRPVRILITGVAFLLLAGITVAATRHSNPPAPVAAGPLPVDLPHTPQSYLGVYAAHAPGSYAGVASFMKSTGATPDVNMYYSGWYEPFKVNFAKTAAQHNAVPLVQIEPTHVRLAAITAGKYDGYLSQFAAAVRTYDHPVILSFGHEMNGTWYTWAYQHTPPAAFVAAWRHIVTLFRDIGASNVTWLWTVNIINRQHNAIPDPAPWWPGKKFVNWVGIDGYYLKPAWTFASLFGPTIAAVRQVTHDPILIAETGASTTAGKPSKIANLFAGIRDYGLLGFVWYDVIAVQDWRIDGNPAALAAFRLGAKAYRRPAS